MTSPWIYRLKMFLAVVVILAFPQLFMHFIGDNPMKVEKNGTRSIAIVNEDIGSDEEDNSLQLGREVPAILGDGSSYKWTVLSRSAATNGLKDKKYDAVVYIPSNFTSNILTYDDTQPKKADFQYTVQTQLNAVNKEKVMRELDYAGNRLDDQMSSLYWNYVSQDMKKVRTEFDRILEKEIEFKTTMINFYEPSSKALADQLQQQKDMLVQLQSGMKQVEGSSPQRANNLDQFQKSLTSFVKYVEQYKEYQRNQQSLLNEAQLLSLSSIDTGKKSLVALQNDNSKLFNEQGNQFIMSMTDMNELLKGNKESITQLSDERLKQVERQIEDMKGLHNNLIDSYIQQQRQTRLSELENRITASRGNVGKGTDNGNGGGNGGDGYTPKEPGDPGSPTKASFQDELTNLEAIKTKVDTINTALQQIQNPTNEVTQAITDLTDVSSQISTLHQNISTKANEDGWKQEYDKLIALYGELNGEYGTLLGEYNDLVKSYDNLKSLNEDNYTTIFDQIKAKEDAIIQLDSNASKLFVGTIKKDTLNGTLDYFALLSEYESVLKEQTSAIKDTVLGDENFKNKVKMTLSLTDGEQGQWNDLIETKFPFTQQAMKGLGDSFSTFKDNYQMSLEDQNKALTENITSIEDSANTVLEKLQDIAAGEPEQAQEGSSLVSNQESISQEILNMNNLMDSLGDRQDSVVSYTGELQGRINNVQSDATLLNQKWTTNVQSTQSIKEDVFNVLGNTFVDGQSNGYVYDYLANPLQVSGDTPQVDAETVKAVPPVVILIVILISSLLIGYFSHYFSPLPLLVKSSIYVLLNLIVGLVISLFGLEIYSLSNTSAIQFSIFTILLLIAASTLVRVAFTLGSFIGWLASIGLILFFVSPLIALVTPNFTFDDPMSAVYMSIQYGTDNHFMFGSFFLIGIIVLLSLIPFAVKMWNKPAKKTNTDNAHEAY